MTRVGIWIQGCPPTASIGLMMKARTLISQTWLVHVGENGGILLGILTGLILLASLALEVFNTKEDNYEFSYLLILMGLSVIRYIWLSMSNSNFIAQMVFMSLAIIMLLLISFGIFLNL